ncbi:MAG: signal peptidase I, partial [Firmicutes bacterium]|nr:signal peptidase I [Bacillota bacterium]
YVYLNGTQLQESYINGNTTPDFGPVQVPEGHYFVMGDNRKNSMDSRDPSVGFVSREKIKGKAMFVFWPPGNIRNLRHCSAGAGNT